MSKLSCFSPFQENATCSPSGEKDGPSSIGGATQSGDYKDRKLPYRRLLPEERDPLPVW